MSLSREMNYMRRQLAKLLAILTTESGLDSLYTRARDLQHHQEDGWFKNKKNEWQRCRMTSTNWDGLYMQESGCSDEFANDFRRRDMTDGCLMCNEMGERKHV